MIPHFRHHFGHPPAALICTQNPDNPQMRLSRNKGAISETHGLPMLFLKFRKILGNVSPPGEAILRILIAAKDSTFRYHLGPPAALIFTQHLDNPQPRLANEKAAILETHGLPRIPLKFWENHGQSITVREALF